MEMTINKALRLKNRTVEKIAKLKKAIQLNNSYREDLGNKYSSADLYEELRTVSAFLVVLKTAIAKANVAIYMELNQIAEIKGLCAMLESLSCVEGTVENSSYSRREGDPLVYQYIAGISEADVAAYVSEYKKELDNLQDSIDKYNATATIDVGELPLSIA
jgi:Mg2+ and Co2+ transporter CorA